MDELYKKASKRKLRFQTTVGYVSVEDLWDIPLINKKNGMSLDNIAKTLNKELKLEEEESFVITTTKRKTIVELKFEIVKDVIKTKLADKLIKETAVLRKANKEKILALIVDKEDDELRGKSKEELEKMIADL